VINLRKLKRLRIYKNISQISMDLETCITFSYLFSVSLEDFHKFKSTADAFKCISKLMKGKIPKSLSKFISKNVVEK
jgi:hypothetical protein